MHDHTRLAAILSLSVLALGSAACASDPVAGTWRQPDATTALPARLGGGPVDVDATFTFDGHATPGTFDLQLELASMGLTDHVDAHGTYIATGTELTLTFTGFTIDPASMNTATVAADGSQCIALHGFLGASVCFPAPQSGAYSRTDDTLTVTLDQAIAGDVVSQTHLTLTKQL